MTGTSGAGCNDSFNGGGCVGMEVPRYGGSGEAAAVAIGSGSEATAESCGDTVLLTDSGARENRLREEHEASLRQRIAR